MKDLGNKRVIYADLSVREDLIFDPLNGSLPPSLHGFRLAGERLRTHTEAEAARQEAEAENTRLREELARLRAGQG